VYGSFKALRKDNYFPGRLFERQISPNQRDPNIKRLLNNLLKSFFISNIGVFLQPLRLKMLEEVERSWEITNLDAFLK
jgi:hypothetical protein